MHRRHSKPIREASPTPHLKEKEINKKRKLHELSESILEIMGKPIKLVCSLDFCFQKLWHTQQLIIAFLADQYCKIDRRNTIQEI